MKTVKYVAEQGCKIKVGGVEYSGTKVIPVGGEKGMSESDIKDLLARKFIRRIDLDESCNETPKQGNEDKEAAKREKLLAKANDLEIDIPEDATNAEIEQAIKRHILLEKAKAASIGVTDEMTTAEIEKLLKEVK
jgi:hypothetical protein